MFVDRELINIIIIRLLFYWEFLKIVFNVDYIYS